MDRLPAKSAVLFALDLEILTGSHLPTLSRGIVLGPALPACAGIILVPVLTHRADGEWAALYIDAGAILTAWSMEDIL